MKKKESKKEVCLDNVLFSRQTKKGENVIVYSKKGKVAYIATLNSKHIFTMKRYNDIFVLLNSLEDKLETPLDFNVSVDFMTMESIMEFLKYNTANSLKDTIGIRLFELLNDLTVQRKALSTKHIVDQYLSISELKKLKAYYDKCLTPREYEGITRQKCEKLQQLGLDKIVFDWQALEEKIDNVLMGRKRLNTWL